MLLKSSLSFLSYSASTLSKVDGKEGVLAGSGVDADFQGSGSV